jgi:hypothetical protein
MRPEAINLWLKLEENSRVCMVQGPPGTGKSSLIWTWACWRACEYNEKLIWIHYSILGDGMKVVLEKNRGVCSSILVCDSLKDVVSEDIASSAFMIVDGITEDLKKKMGEARSTLPFRAGAKLVFVLSYSIDIPLQEKEGWIEVEMFSWTFDQYKNACDNDNFVQGIKHNIYPAGSGDDNGNNWNYHMGCKFNLAGASARWFFGLPPNETESEIRPNIERFNFTCGHRKKGFVHHLFALFADKKDFVSQFVARQLAFNYDMNTVQTLLNKEVVRKGKSLGGWIIEWAFLTALIYASKKKTPIKVYNSEEIWNVNEVVTFDPDNPSVPLCDWLIPERCNQGGYDFLQLTKLQSAEYLLRVFQITHEMKHPYRLEFVCTLLAKLKDLNIGEIKYLDVVMVHEKNYTPPAYSPTGFLQLNMYTDLFSKTNWKEENIRVLSFDVLDACGF